jgi:hypothetical protein
MENVTTNSLIESTVEGLTFVDIGGLWGTVNERVTIALAAGASKATMMDYQVPESDWWIKFHQRAAEMGFKGKYTSISANLDDADLVERYGAFDFVHCSGIIYHAPSPFHTLMRLRALTKKYLILGSMTVPDRIYGTIGQIDMTDGAAYFVPALSGKKLEIFREHFLRLGVDVHNIVSEERHPWMFAGEPNYAPWWWLWSPETLAAMAEAAGFKLLKIYESWESRAHGIFLRAV